MSCCSIHFLNWLMNKAGMTTCFMVTCFDQTAMENPSATPPDGLVSSQVCTKQHA
jgi:hypothetical protein